MEAKLNQLKGALHSPAAVNHAFDQVCDCALVQGISRSRAGLNRIL